MVSIGNLHPQYITDENGNKTSVILALPEFIELVEDIEDLAVVAERREELTISHEKLLSEFSKEGLL